MSATGTAHRRADPLLTEFVALSHAGAVVALSPLETVGLFVAIPLGLVAAVTVLVLLPGSLRRPRYRPGRSYASQTVWYGGPDDAETAVDEAVPTSVTGGSRGRW